MKLHDLPPIQGEMRGAMSLSAGNNIILFYFLFPVILQQCSRVMMLSTALVELWSGLDVASVGFGAVDFLLPHNCKLVMVILKSRPAAESSRAKFQV